MIKIKGNSNGYPWAMISNPFKERFYEKGKEKSINILTVFSIFHKSGVKTFLK